MRPTFSGWNASTSFSGTNRVQNAGRIDALGQRQLHQDAMHAGVAVQLIDQRQELIGRRLGRQPVQTAGQPVLLAGLLLAADIDLAGRIFAHQDCGQARLHAGAASELADLGRDLGTDLFGQGFAVQTGSQPCWQP